MLNSTPGKGIASALSPSVTSSPIFVPTLMMKHSAAFTWSSMACSVVASTILPFSLISKRHTSSESR